MRRRWIALLVVIGLGVALRGALPFVLTRVLEDQVARNSPFVLEIGNLDLELIAGRVHANRASLRAESTTPAEGPRLLLGTLDLEIAPWALLDRRLKVLRVALRDVALRAAQSESGAIDWLALLEETATDAPAPAPDASSEPFSLVLDHAALSALAIELHHEPSGRVFHQTIDATVDEFALSPAAPPRPAATPVDREPQRAEAPGLSEAPSPASGAGAAQEPSDGSFRFAVRSQGDVGDLALTARARLTPLQVNAEIVAKALDLVGISALLDDPSLDLGSGSLALDLDVHAAAGAAAPGEPTPLVVTANGSIGAATPQLSLPASGIAASLASLDVQLGSLRIESGGEKTAVDLAVKLGAQTIETDLAEGASVAADSFEAELDVRLRSGGGGLEVSLAGPLETRGTRLAFPSAGIREASFEALSIHVDTLDVVSADEKLQLKSKARLDASGHTSELALELGDGLRAETLRFESLRVPIDGLDLAGPTVQLGQVVVAKPRLELRRIAASGAKPDGEVEPAATASTAGASSADGAAPAAALRLELAGLELRGGRIRLDDETLEPAHAVQLSGIAVDLHRLRVGGVGGVGEAGVAGPQLEGGELRVASLGTEPLLAKLSMQGRRLNATLRGEQIDLAPFAPYAEQAAGYAITGSISAEVDATGDGDEIGAPIDLVFQDLTLSNPQQDAPLAKLFQEIGVSLDLALALLRDPKGRISLNIPIASSEAGTTVRLAPILRDGLVQALTGALASPLKLVGASFETLTGGEDPTLARIFFAPGASAVPAEATEAITRVARLLANRPGLQVVLRARATRSDQQTLAASLGAPLAEGVEAPLSAELRDALATLRRERLAAVRASLVADGQLAVDAAQLLEEADAPAATAPLEADAAALDIRIAGARPAAD